VRRAAYAARDSERSRRTRGRVIRLTAAVCALVAAGSRRKAA